MVSRGRSLVRGTWEACWTLRSWTKRMGEVPMVRWTERCSVRLLTPMAVIAELADSEEASPLQAGPHPAHARSRQSQPHL
ncbi:hypothetical protein ADL28_12980 [Streptomyces violaceusniger]|uniref:Uncharacterized protein n=1 Tax=Streptomyces violaceusniger TaxID=68280 RepID=A0A0X3X0C2_STRVO|nr:hypothetical protein ADL28_12980 [Streptomyces violaceusniger]